MERFNKIFEFIKSMEGGYNKIPADTGGQTIFGIAQSFNKDLTLWVEIKAHFGAEIAKFNKITARDALSRRITAYVASRPDLMAEIRQTYYNRYFVPSCAYCFDAPIDVLLMDSYFNMGIAAKKILQKWAGMPESEQDGIIGPKSRAAIRACTADPALLLRLRWEYYQTRDGFETFGNGWKNRLIELAKFINRPVEL